jgi:hypothetical protein
MTGRVPEQPQKVEPVPEVEFCPDTLAGVCPNGPWHECSRFGHGPKHASNGYSHDRRHACWCGETWEDG